MAVQGAVGAPAWLMASLPHGNAYGHRSRSASAATHQPATATGQARSDSSTRWPTASRAKMTASAMASAAQAYQARLISQDSSGMKNASPNSNPTAKLARRLRPCSASTSSAGPSGASGHAPTGGKAAVRTSPPATAASKAHPSARRGSPGSPRPRTGTPPGPARHRAPARYRLPSRCPPRPGPARPWAGHGGTLRAGQRDHPPACRAATATNLERSRALERNRAAHPSHQSQPEGQAQRSRRPAGPESQRAGRRPQPAGPRPRDEGTGPEASGGSGGRPPGLAQ